ncbi:MAG: HPr kinase/phosphatase C-terminal domain-containing protein [Pseudomonadota bacterium]
MRPHLVHASTIAVGDRAVLIRGAAGSGKSSLALQLMAYGADLVADDQTALYVEEGRLWAQAPPTIAGLIEARGVGLLNAHSRAAPVTLVVDLDRTETQRLPALHHVSYLGLTIPCLYKVDAPAWPAAILQYLKRGRQEPQ